MNNSKTPWLFPPRWIRVGAAPMYLSIDRNRFNALIRPMLTQIELGPQTIVFDRLEIDEVSETLKELYGTAPRTRG